MKTPGVTVRPLITIDGGHEVNEVFLENVKVPSRTASARRTRAGRSPSTCSATSAAASPASPAPSAALSACAGIAAGQPADDGGPLLADPAFKRKIAELEIDLSALEYTELRTLAAEQGGHGPGPEASLLKIKGTEIGQRLTELTLEAAGVYGAPYFRGFPRRAATPCPSVPTSRSAPPRPTTTCARPASSAGPTRYSATS
jgi:alkylation response protein AidB-like acyl-CoA dehydrogenase